MTNNAFSFCRLLSICKLFLTTVGLLMCTASVWGFSDSNEPTITVSGDAEVQAVPDEIIIRPRIFTRARSVADASKESDAVVKSFREFLKKQGIEDKFVKATTFQISPIARREPYQSISKQSYQAPNLPPQNNQGNNDPFGEDPSGGDSNGLKIEPPIGYQVDRTYSVTITDLSKFEAIYKGLISLGVNIDVGNVEFRSTKIRELKDEVRLLAVAAAKDKAAAMAGKLGAKLSSVKTVQESGNTGHIHAYSSMSPDPFDGAPGRDIPGQISISASVQVVFVLKDVELP